MQRSLARHGFSVGALHGDMDQRSRMATLDDFRNNRLTLLVASDVAARGLDIPAVSHIFNFDVPTHAEDYIHRIGRTGRAGRVGTAITIATPARPQIRGGDREADRQPIETLEVEASDELAAARYGKRAHKESQRPRQGQGGDAPVRPGQEARQKAGGRRSAAGGSPGTQAGGRRRSQTSRRRAEARVGKAPARAADPVRPLGTRPAVPAEAGADGVLTPRSGV